MAPSGLGTRSQRGGGTGERGGGSRHRRDEAALQRADPRPACRLRRPAPRLPGTRGAVTVLLDKNQHFIL